MKIKRGPITFHNLLKMTDTCKREAWPAMAKLMRNFVVMNGLYTNAPAFYQVVPVKEDKERWEYTVYVPISAPVKLDKDIPMEFVSELSFDDALMFRIVDPTTLLEEAYFFLDVCAKEQGYKLVRPFYHVCYDVFGEPMTDVIAPVKAPEKKAGKDA
ncbi:MAG: DUF5085 family protein [Coriobacteriales bacterium]|jgi:hypothetical protein|nr:DUF5085 family protein [Coriobacteriales bacterium]